MRRALDASFDRRLRIFVDTAPRPVYQSSNGTAWGNSSTSFSRSGPKEWGIRVEPSMSGAVRTYTNPRGAAFQPVQDTSAFSTCP